MKIVNSTPFPFAPYAGRVPHPGHSMTLIVKGTFDLVHEGVAQPADEQLFPTGDEYHADDDEGQGSVRYESDFAYFKPSADLLLAGTCLPPGGGDAHTCDVAFQVGRFGKRLIVTGDRHWRGPMGLGGASDPEPFSKLVLRYENSFGGEGRDQNPVGIGYGKSDGDEGESIRSLPKIENPDSRVTSIASRPEPAGFGPLGRGWKYRSKFLGTYKSHWLKHRWPWFPEDFDYSYFNAASPDMQVPYLAGDELVQCENLHPDHAEFRCRLPGLRVRCFVNESDTNLVETNGGFHEVEMNLDTLWVDMDARKLVLVWRGVADVGSDEFENVEHVYVRAEALDPAPASLETCQREFHETLSSAEVVPEAEPVPADEAAAPTAEESGEGLEAAAAAEAATMRDEAKAGVLAMLAAAGIPMTSLPAEVEELIDSMIAEDSESSAVKDKAEADSKRKEAYAQAGLDPDNLPPLSDKAREEQLRLLGEIGIDNPVEMLSDPETARMLNTISAVLPMVGISAEDLSGVIDQVRKIRGASDAEEGQAEAELADERTRPFTREQVELEAAQGESFANEDLSGLDLSGLDLAGLDFTGANLAATQLADADAGRAVFANANLEGADLSNAILAGADFSNANLTAANFDGAACAETTFSESLLAGTCFDGADLTSANLAGCAFKAVSCCDATFNNASLAELDAPGTRASGSKFVGADLAGACFAESDVTSADFSKATLNGADFSSATLVAATLEQVTCIAANFSKADATRLRASDSSDFSQSNFSQMIADESMWESANLVAADLSYSKMHAANFLKATLTGANLNAADMSQTRFMQANLSDAELIGGNFFEGSFERADLSGADFRNANLYAAEFLDAKIADARFDGANVKRSKLA